MRTSGRVYERLVAWGARRPRRDLYPGNGPYPDGLLAGLGCRVDTDGFVIVDGTGRTSVNGVWATGNVVDPRAQVITAAGAGSAAAIAINADLVQDDISAAVRAHETTSA